MSLSSLSMLAARRGGEDRPLADRCGRRAGYRDQGHDSGRGDRSSVEEALQRAIALSAGFLPG
jgi:hypothetical protein